MQKHKISKILDLLTEKSQELSKMYQDDDNLLSDELQLMRSGNPGMFSTFYETLNSTKEYHQRFPDQHLLSSTTASSKPLITDPNNIIATSSSAIPSFKSTIDALNETLRGPEDKNLVAIACLILLSGLSLCVVLS